MVMMSTANKKWWRRQDKKQWWRWRWRWRWRTINWKGGSRRRETTATRDSNERQQRQWIGNDDCGGLWRLPLTAMLADDMSLNNGGMQELAADDDGKGMRPGGKQTRHSAFIRGNNC